MERGRDRRRAPEAFQLLRSCDRGFAIKRSTLIDSLAQIAASIQTGTVTASLIMRQLAAYPRQNSIAAALRELGRLERTLFTLEWIEDPELRRDTGRELNKGESRNSLARAVFIHRSGKCATAPTKISSIAPPA